MSKLGRTQRITAAAAAAATLLGSVVFAAGTVSAAPAGPGTVIYTEANATAAQGGNAVLAFRAGADGALMPTGSFSTGGDGTAMSLGSQGAIGASGDGRYLVAVNAGSNSLSAFMIGPRGNLRLLDTVASGGTMPVSMTLRGKLVYALNAGDGSVAGFRLSDNGLEPIAGDVQSLSQGASGAAEVAVSPDGMHLLVTEKGSNTLDTFAVTADGMIGQAQGSSSVGGVPYGFAFTRDGVAVVSDAADSALSTYLLRGPGALRNVAEVPDGQLAACWVAVTDDGIAFTSNAHSGNLSSYRVGPDGQLTLLEPVAATTGGAPVDLALSPGQRTLYALNAGSSTIATMWILPDGHLSTPDAAAVVPPTAVGLAAVEA